METHVLRAIVLILALSSCNSVEFHAQQDSKAHDFYTNYISISDRKSHFQDYSLADQYEIYIFGNRVVHPPATYLAESLAQQGPKVVSFLKDKVERETDEARLRDILLVLSWSAKLKCYDYSKDPIFTALLKKKVAGMTGIWKNTAVQSLAVITSGQ